MRFWSQFGPVLLGATVVFGGMGATGGESNQSASAAVASTKPDDIASAETTATSALPEGNNGIARKYRCHRRG